MKRLAIPALIAAVAIGVIFVGSFYWDNLRGAFTAFGPIDGDITKSINTTGMPLKLPPGFSIEIFAKDLPGARVAVQDSFGNWWVSQPAEGKVTLLEVGEDGKVKSQNSVFTGLKKPHGLAFDIENPFLLYIAEENKISRVGTYSEDTLHKIADLPSGAGHSTRTIAFGPDGRLYVSIGSSCNVCNESDARRAAIYSMKPDGSDFKLFAKGLRNSVFFDWSYVDGRMWATDMGRDLIGDDIPPEEINIVEEGKNYGWPICYGKNIHDTDFDKNTYIRNPCMEPFETPSYIDMQAHSAPLGLTFVPEESWWPEEYWYDLIVALHGSWNRTTPTGYKLIRVKLDAQGNYEGTEDFITGWLQDPRPGGGEVLGRPVQVVAKPGGVLYVTDDKAGVIYKITYGRETKQEISSFDECAAAGYPVMESYPRQCAVPGEKSFVEIIGNELEKNDLIRINTPRPNSEIKSPLLVEGEARGYWFFEASFPVRLLDANGENIPIDPPYIMATEEWMTENFVPFSATLKFNVPKTKTGTLVLQKDNPSGLPEHDDELRVPVYFNLDDVTSIPYEKNGGKYPSGACRPTGCSGASCSDRDLMTICLYQPEFVCYKNAVCERQSDGKCGWTQTPELQSCLKKYQTGE